MAAVGCQSARGLPPTVCLHQGHSASLLSGTPIYSDSFESGVHHNFAQKRVWQIWVSGRAKRSSARHGLFHSLCQHAAEESSFQPCFPSTGGEQPPFHVGKNVEVELKDPSQLETC
ncbi:unnamed protein product [Pleuronectes platessa]|uniref:Uncharacterized protein n=1 Tax=Pleuronectes platessa TaxID=8262 RepID=A0A9N7VJK7_PLEPL|nr:unnamed protein product [Pleuronectes platessa]